MNPLDQAGGAPGEGAGGSARTSAIALILSNAVPLLGVLFGRWDTFMVVLLFWAENLVIGFFNVLKMLTCRGQGTEPGCVRFFLPPFFAVHYGGFCLVHGAFVFVLFGGKGAGGGFRGSPADLFPMAFGGSLLYPLLALFLSHGISFVTNYWLGGERERATVSGLMFRPYGRIVVLHVTILLGGFLAMATGGSKPALLLLVLLKTGIDLVAHLNERSVMHGGEPRLRFVRRRRRRTNDMT